MQTSDCPLKGASARPRLFNGQPAMSSLMETPLTLIGVEGTPFAADFKVRAT